MTNKTIYLAYGSNMSLAQMHHRCPDAEPIGKGFIKDWRLMFKGSKSGNYATIEPDHSGIVVPVVAWAISAEDEQCLDRYEGWPNFYVKETVEFCWGEYGRPGRHKKGKGMVYILPPEKSKLGMPSSAYTNILEEGYSRFGFDYSILEEALIYTGCSGY